jgi:Domain of Unknown Function (DUF1206)
LLRKTLIFGTNNAFPVEPFEPANCETRAVVSLMMGAFLGFAAYDSNSQEALGLTGVLRKLQHQSYGELLLGIAGLGLLAFGCFEIIKALARRLRPN